VAFAVGDIVCCISQRLRIKYSNLQLLHKSNSRILKARLLRKLEWQLKLPLRIFAFRIKKDSSVSNLKHLLSLYQQSEQVKKITTALDTKTRCIAAGLSGSQLSFVLAAQHLQSQKPILLIAKDKDEAAYFHDDLATLTQQEQVFFFPDSFKRPAYFDDLNKTAILQRSETVNKITEKTNLIPLMVTYPEALFEKVVSPEVLNDARILIKVGEKLDIDFVMEVLIEYGFERSDFVFEPGQFSLRGGIVDLYSYGNDLPYRIELFDDEVESIRIFEPNTQLSKRNVQELRIVPNLNSRFRHDQKVSLFKVIPHDTIIWVSNYQELTTRLQMCFERAETFAAKLSGLDSEELREVFRDRAFLYPNDVVTEVEQHPLFFLEDQELPTELDVKKQTVKWNSKQHPSFNKNFELLGRTLFDNTQSEINTYICSENTKQFDRLEAIFKDLKLQVQFLPIEAGLKEGFVDPELRAAVYTDHQIFARYHQYKVRQGFAKDDSLSIRLIRELQPGDFVTHIDHGIGKFSGLEKIEIGGQKHEAVRLMYKNNDLLYVSIHSLHKLAKYSSKDGAEPQLSKLGSDSWKQLKARTKRKIKDIAEELIKLYAMRRTAKGHSFPPDSYLQTELEASFLYEDTPDQEKATIDVKADMEREYPMDRLICGDVGFGKTEIAVRAAFKAVCDGKQVALLVPTTILALQHWKTFSERLADFPVTVDYLNRFRTTKERKEIMQRATAGKIDILIGTHALLNKDLKFKDLGLLVVDEEQKFGVASKEKLRSMAIGVDTLTLTATPIPRTLQFSLMAARDMSVIRTPPPNRQPIHTEIRVSEDRLITDAIVHEVSRGGQVFFVHNRVNDLLKVAENLRALCPGVDIGVGHGQLPAEELEKVLIDFIDRKFDVLVCTNIIETGLDIPNANTILINRADMFGLSDLHQLRGRVGRSNVKAYCYLLAPPMSLLPTDTRKRLRTIEEFSELGGGINVAMRDLDIRGAGNLLGGEQSGFIADIGFETYQKILDEAIQELKESQFKDVFKDELAGRGSYVRDVTIETDIEMLIPDQYVTNTQERLALYTELNAVKDEKGVEAFQARLKDRFGKIPKEVQALFEALRLQWICRQLGFDRLILKGRKLRCYFVGDPQSSFYETAHFQSMVAFVTKHGRIMGVSFKQTNKDFILVQDEVSSIAQAKKTLEKLLAKEG
jgi:transcription-repair coupling factor (superfamily II helicase)